MILTDGAVIPNGPSEPVSFLSPKNTIRLSNLNMASRWCEGPLICDAVCMKLYGFTFQKAVIVTTLAYQMYRTNYSGGQIYNLLTHARGTMDRIYVEHVTCYDVTLESLPHYISQLLRFSK